MLLLLLAAVKFISFARTGSRTVFWEGTFHVQAFEVHATTKFVNPPLTAASMRKNMAVMWTHEPPNLQKGLQCILWFLVSF